MIQGKSDARNRPVKPGRAARIRIQGFFQAGKREFFEMQSLIVDNVGNIIELPCAVKRIGIGQRDGEENENPGSGRPGKPVPLFFVSKIGV